MFDVSAVLWGLLLWDAPYLYHNYCICSVFKDLQLNVLTTLWPHLTVSQRSQVFREIFRGTTSDCMFKGVKHYLIAQWLMQTFTWEIVVIFKIVVDNFSSYESSLQFECMSFLFCRTTAYTYWWFCCCFPTKMMSLPRGWRHWGLS